MLRIKLEERASRNVEREGEPKRSVPIGHESSVRQFLKLKGEKNRRSVVRLGKGGDLQVPQVVRGSFGASEEGEWGCWGVVKQARSVSEDGMAVRPNQWRNAEQGM